MKCLVFAVAVSNLLFFSSPAKADRICGLATDVHCIDKDENEIEGDFSFCTQKTGAQEAAEKKCKEAGGKIVWDGGRQK